MCFVRGATKVVPLTFFESFTHFSEEICLPVSLPITEVISLDRIAETFDSACTPALLALRSDCKITFVACFSPVV